jgi:hypothetical protein
MCQGNRLRAAQFLGIGRTSLYYYLKRDGLDTRLGKRNPEAQRPELQEITPFQHLMAGQENAQVSRI